VLGGFTSPSNANENLTGDRRSGPVLARPGRPRRAFPMTMINESTGDDGDAVVGPAVRRLDEHSDGPC
jgi:hypothetical protein